MGTVSAGLRYFALVFAAGFVLGFVRVLWLAPRIGPRVAELLEAPIMLVVIVLAARHVVARIRPHPGRGRRLGIGLIALAVLLATEVGVVLWLQGLTLRDAIAGRDPINGAVYVASLILMVIMPLVVRRA